MPDSKITSLTGITTAADARAAELAASVSAADRKVLGGQLVGAAQLVPFYDDTSVYLTGLQANGSNNILQAPLANYIWCNPFIAPTPARTMTELAASVATAVAGNMRIGILNADPETHKPTTVLVQSGDISTGTTGKKTATISQALIPGTLYYLFSHFSANPTMAALIPVGNSMLFGATYVGGLNGLARNIGSYGAVGDQTGQTFLFESQIGIYHPAVGVR